MIGETEEGAVFWVAPEELESLELAPNMDKYLKTFTGRYSECYCSVVDGDWSVIYR